MYFIVAGAFFGLLVAWSVWRESTCGELSRAVQLDHPGTYELKSRAFARDTYVASFLIKGPLPPSFDRYKADEQLWQDSPPEVRIEVFDPAGRPLLAESSSLQRSAGWTITSYYKVDVHKFFEVIGAPLREHTVRLSVLRGSRSAATYSVTFRFERLCGFNFGHVLLFPLLAFVFTVIAIILALALRFTRRQTTA